MVDFNPEAKHFPYSYDHLKMKSHLGEVLQQNVDPEVWNWLNDKCAEVENSQSFNAAFAMMPRKTGKAITVVDQALREQIEVLVPGMTIDHWAVDRLSRVWFISNTEPSDKNIYTRRIEALFDTAEMNELIALYSALPLLAYGKYWRLRGAEGIRSNIGNVLEAIMCNNPYPTNYFEEGAWNQLVLKAFFTEKPVERIFGLDRRANKELAKILSDYAHERWAAGRKVNPLLWRCVSDFVDENLYSDIERLSKSKNLLDQQAAALVCKKSNYQDCKNLIKSNDFLQQTINDEHLTWNSLAKSSV